MSKKGKTLELQLDEVPTEIINALPWQTPYEKHEIEGEVNHQASETIPDQALTVREIMQRFSRGLPIGSRAPIYDEEDTLPDPRTLDLVEIQALREEAEALQKKIDNDRKLLEKQQLEKKEAEKLEALKKQWESEQSTQNPQK